MPIDEDPIRVLTDLRPAAAKDIAASSYAHRREQDLARILATLAASPASQPRSRWQRPGLLGGAIGLTAAAGAVAVAVASVPGGPRPAGYDRSGATALSARTVLLASAEAAARTPAATGSYWFVSDRTVVKEQTIATHERKIPAPFTAYVADTEQSWSPARGGVTRIVTGIGYQLIFPSAADESKWKAMGSPDMHLGYPDKPTTSDDRFPGGMLVQIGNHQLTLVQVERLPETVTSLEKTLRGLWTTDAVIGPNGSHVRSSANFTGFVWAAAQELLAEPVTPSTKAALFRLLAEQPGITARKAIDDLGRAGVSLSIITEGEQESLIITPSTGQLLAWVTSPAAGGAAGKDFDVSDTFQRIGWTGQLGVPAGS
jgi:hypothetical protein